MRELQSVSFVSFCANLTCLTAKYRRLPGAEGGGKVAWGLLDSARASSRTIEGLGAARS